MKAALKAVGNTKPQISRMTSKQSQSLLQKAQRITQGLNAIRQGQNIVKAIIFPNDVAVPGPMESSLGHKMYQNSAEQGFFGPVSPEFRFPWDHVQHGLVMKKQKLHFDDALAVCNDGSSAVIYMHNKSSTHWHFHVDGGFFCYDKNSCLMRAKLSPAQASTKGWELFKNGSGMFDPVMGGFPDYTHAHAGYCSSDAWMGQLQVTDYQMIGGTKMPDGTTGTYFRGYTIQQAILKRFMKM